MEEGESTTRRKAVDSGRLTVDGPRWTVHGGTDNVRVQRWVRSLALGSVGAVSDREQKAGPSFAYAPADGQ